VVWASSSGVGAFLFHGEGVVATGGHSSELQWQIVAGQFHHRERLQLGWSGHNISIWWLGVEKPPLDSVLQSLQISTRQGQQMLAWQVLLIGRSRAEHRVAVKDAQCLVNPWQFAMTLLMWLVIEKL